MSQASENQNDRASSAVERNGNGQKIGYYCDDLVKKNKLASRFMRFYFDLAYPNATGQFELGVEHVSQVVLDTISTEYGIQSGETCENPPFDESSWMVKFTSDPSQYNKVDLFKRCRSIEPVFDQSCAVVEGVAQGWVIGVPESKLDLPDVEDSIEAVLNSDLFVNSPFEVSYLGKPVSDPSNQEQGRNNLNPPSSIKEAPPPVTPQGRRTVTIVGGLLVAAFCIAFFGIVAILYRRRQNYLRSRDVQLALSKSDLHFHEHGADSEEGPGKTLEQETNSDDYMDGLDQVKSSDTESFPNNITFDLGNSFKDQLMGVHGRSATRNMPPFGMRAPSDNQSDSDADSWAQTDGTIGSLELQLEPITAEV